ncbi:hypothetical protein [Methylobacterium sp. J-092]|uniref:hypothetical protein n=1 Tax=Methylobacterium sp. J-092 TaxID=2836667 RepID=UPI001FBAF44B|nr:hypothetical protein [Methylobacterium sp. J-092]MCJ2005522.1 hypothetical protein [Methylobacterium sp. J-092]
MPKPPRLDLRRLERDVADAAPRSAGLAPGGRRATGLMDVVRDNLDALVTMQASGVTWNAIAAALTKQGYATGDGRPLTGAQITGIISSVRRQAKHRADKAVTRQARLDLLPPVPDRRPERRLHLSADLVAPTESRSPTAAEAADTEEAIRRGNLDKLQDLLKPASPKKD